MKLKPCLTAMLALALASGCRTQGPTEGRTAAAAGATGDTTWETYPDPLEQAFTMQVPRGWTVKGGMFRLGYSDHRIMLDMISPDGKTNIRLGDVAIPTYFLPNQFHHEGEIYDLGAQAQGRVAKYRSGQEFAQAYGKIRFAPVCQALTLQPPSLPPIMTPEAKGASEGETAYSCGGSEGARPAYVYAQTARAGSLWQVTTLISYVAAVGQEAQTRDVIRHSIKSFQLSPAWVQRQNQLDQEALVYQRQRQQARMRQLSQQVAQFEMRMQAMRNQVADFERGQAQRQSQFEAMDNVINGITPTVDPYGNKVDVFIGPNNNYYRNPGTGTIVNANQSPGPGWDRLKETQ
jgi:hypothetical protein